MIISLTCINSVMVYFQTIINAKNKTKWLTPFVFVFFIFFEWCLFNFFIINYGVNYSSIFDGFITLYALGTSGFFIYYLSKWKFWFTCKWEFAKQLPILIALLFITIFFIFYQKGYAAEQSDLWFYYQMMNYLHVRGTNSFNNPSLLIYNRYLNIGLYQLGASLSLPQRLFIFPYFTTYFFFFVIFTSTYEVLSYFLKSNWKKIVIFFLVLIMFLFLYWYCNPATYTIMIGNIESSFLLTIILLPSFLHFKNESVRWTILLLFAGFLFYNETAVLVELFYLIAYLGFIFIFRNKYHFTLLYYLSTLIFFILPLYLFIYDYLTLFNSFSNHVLTIFLIISIITYCECAYFAFMIALKKFAISWISNLRVVKWVNKVWNLAIIENKAKAIVKNKKIKLCLTVSFSILMDLFIVFSVFDLGFTSNISVGQWIVAGILGTLFLVIFSWMIFKQIYSPFFIYFCILLTVVFVLHCFALSYHDDNSWVLQRVTYIGLFPTYVQEGLIHDMVLLTYFILLILPSISFAWLNKLIANKPGIKLLFNHLDLGLLSLACLSIGVIVPACQAEVSSIYYLNLKDANSANLLGLSANSWLQFQAINFHHELVFSDIFLPIANDTLAFNINHVNYPAYGDIANFYNFKLNFRKPICDLSGQQITKYNQLSFTNEILPYYNWVVIKSNDSFMLNILQNDKMYTLDANINHQLLIYKNDGINMQLQAQFVHYNPIINITSINESYLVRLFSKVAQNSILPVDNKNKA